jgi:methionyl-tRNA synthetase
VVKPLELAQTYGPEAFRYFVLREMAFGLDAAFSEEALVGRYNSDLANDLGNLFSRVMNMLHQFRGGVVPGPGLDEAVDEPFRELSRRVSADYVAGMETFAFHRALAALWELIGEANRFVVVNEPWTLAKDPVWTDRLDQVMYLLSQTLAAVTVMISPVMPETARVMAGHLGLGEIAAPGMLERIKAGQALLAAGTRTTKPTALFPRIDTAKVAANTAKATSAPKKEDKIVTDLAYEDFAKVDLRLGLVKAAEKVEGADRLLKLTIDLGEPRGPRTVVAGIAQHYSPEEMQGRQVVVVANLKPVKLKGVESCGMVLACVGDDKVRIVSPDLALSPGSKVS